MRTPFARPETSPQWLLGSVGWVFGAWIAYVAVVLLSQRLVPNPPDWLRHLLNSGLLLVHVLLWYKAVPASWRAAREGGAAGSVLVWPARLWLLLLLAFQLYCLAILLLALLLALSGPLQF